MSTTIPTTTARPIRSAEARDLPPLPWGWFVVCLSAELADGAVRSVHYFGRDLVVFRTASGRVAVLDAHCPHLGADLGVGGEVVGESIRCPFHHWRFGPDGACVEVPRCDRIPPKARADAWVAVEQNGVVLAWFHPEGAAPSFEVPRLADEGWTAARSVRWRIRSHPQEIGENTVDTAHMRPVHETEPSTVTAGPTLDGRHMNIGLAFWAPGEIVGVEGENFVELDVWMHGLGLIYVTARVEEANLTARYRICSTPIDREQIDIFGVVNVKEDGDPEYIAEVAELFFEALKSDFVKDFPIWENKVYRGRPVLSGADGPIGTYRRWARQFHGVAQGRPGAFASAREGLGEDASEAPPRRRLRAALLSAKGLLRRVRAALPRRDEDAGEAAGRDADAAAGTSAAGERHPRPAAKGAAPALRVDSVAHYFATLGERFVPGAAAGVDAVFQWELRGEGGCTRHAIVKDGALELVDGAHPEPSVTLTLDAADYVQVVNGELDGKRVFTSGRGKVAGKLRLAMKMQKIFPQ
ncbi:MAG: Rieske 2Fe-2S domain-containing protein [Nannocystaceae bacterium]